MRKSVRVKTGRTDDPRSFFGYTDFGGLDEIDFDSWNELRLRTLRYDPRMDGWQGPVTVNRED